MSTMTMTMIGLYRNDSTVFDNMILPDGLDRELVINTILMRSGEFEVLYPNPDFMKFSIGAWSRKWSKTFTDWIKGQNATWNPIENYDRYEEFSDSGSTSGTKSGSSTSSGSSSGSDSFGSEGSNENLVSAYDSNTYQPSAKNITGTENSSESSSETSASSTDSETSSETTSSTRTGHIHGNIGVTQASDMLKAFYDISQWNIYDHIADVFVTEYCIPIY